MKAIFFSLLAAAIFIGANATTCNPSGVQCDIACIPPSAHDPNALPCSCNCAERHCPPGPECPVGAPYYGWNKTTNDCGCLATGDLCAGLTVKCADGYTYGWNSTKYTCMCIPNKLPRRDFVA